MTVTLRPFQVEGIERTLTELRAGKRRVCVVAPTGSGKTVVLSELTRRHNVRGGRTLVVVHRDLLVAQTRNKLLAAGLERVGIIAAGRDEDHDAPVLVASVQTLLARGALPAGITLMILDEAHHYLADEWRRIAEHYASAYVMGFTATPMRSDGTPLGDIFDALVIVIQTPELMELGHLCPIDVIAPPRETDGLCAEPIAAWREHARGKPTIVFCASVDAARELAADITAEGGRAAPIWGDMPAEDREREAEDARDEEIARLRAKCDGFDRAYTKLLEQNTFLLEAARGGSPRLEDGTSVPKAPTMPDTRDREIALLKAENERHRDTWDRIARVPIPAPIRVSDGQALIPAGLAEEWHRIAITAQAVMREHEELVRRATRKDLVDREIERLRGILRQIGAWDQINPPQPMSDGPWLRGLVDEALEFDPRQAPGKGGDGL
jgi:hypothetical protein